MIMVCFVPLLRHLHNTKQLEKKIDQQQPNSPRRKEINFVIGNKIKKIIRKLGNVCPFITRICDLKEYKIGIF